MSYDAEAEWFSSEIPIGYQEWQNYRERLAADLDVDEARLIVGGAEGPHEAFHGPLGKNWTLFMPRGAISRLRETSDPYDEVSKIVSETAKNAALGGDVSPAEQACVGKHVIDYFQGLVDFDQLDGTDLPPPSDERDYSFTTVVVQSVNENLYEDWEVYTVGDEFFGGAAGSSTHMFHQLQTSGLEPDHSVTHVAYYPEDDSVPERFRPGDRFVAATVSSRSRVSLSVVENPERYFQNQQSGKQHIDLDHVYNLHTGIRW